jgi:hypothetical protein
LNYKINVHAKNIKNNNNRDIDRGINEFKKGCQHRSYLVKYESGDLLADPLYIFNRWRNYFYHLLNVHLGRDLRKIVIQTAQMLVPDHCPFKFKIATAKLKSIYHQAVIN